MWIGFDFFASGKCRDGVGFGGVKQGGSFTIGGIRQAQASADPFADVQRVVAARIAQALVTARIPVKVIAVQKDGKRNERPTLHS